MIKKLYAWTFWTLPYRNSSTRNIFKTNILYLLYSTELISNIQNTERVIFTDSIGYDILKTFDIKAEIVISKALNELTEKDIHRWAYSKITTIDFLKAPFYHIDHDVFIYKEQRKKNTPITAQSLEINEIYRNTYTSFVNCLNQNYSNFLPKDLQEYANKNIGGINCGYLHIQCDTNKEEWMKLSKSLFDKYNYKHYENNDLYPDNKNFVYAPGLEKLSINVISEQFTLFYLNHIKNNEMVSFLFDSLEYYEWRSPEYIHLPYPSKQQNLYPSEGCMNIYIKFAQLNRLSAINWKKFRY